MSNKQNDLYLEEVSEAEEEYQDALLALQQATKDFDEAYHWKRNRESWANDCAEKLKTLKNKND